MKNGVILIGFLFLIAFLSASAFANPVKQDWVKAEIDKNALMNKVSSLQIPFIENQGQIKDNSVKFYANTFAGIVFITDKGEIVYSLNKSEPRTQSTDSRHGLSLRAERSNLKSSSGSERQNLISKAALRETLKCPEETKITGMNKAETKVNYFVGDKDNWRTNIQTWQEVRIGEVYKGIELKLRAYGKNVEKIFTVNPNSSVNDIKLILEGAKGLHINEGGELEVETELGTVKFTKPFAYQEETVNGQHSGVSAQEQNITITERQYIEVAYVVKGNEYGFKVGNYDSTKPLVIDPLLASTLIGGSSVDSSGDLAIDSSGNVFIVGDTRSLDYPTTSGAYDTSHNGGSGSTPMMYSCQS